MTAEYNQAMRRKRWFVKSFKAMLWGGVFITVGMLLMQLLFLFVVVGYNAVAESMPVLHSLRDAFRYLLGVPVYLLIMFGGGYITAEFAEKKVILHSFLLGVLFTLVVTLLALQNAQLTLMGVVTGVLSIAATTVGGYIWQRGSTLPGA